MDQMLSMLQIFLIFLIFYHLNFIFIFFIFKTSIGSEFVVTFKNFFTAVDVQLRPDEGQ